jgi:hypothetical protein
MHLRLYMHEHSGPINKSFKYKFETCQDFKHPFKDIVMSARCNSWIMYLTYSKWMI